MKNKKKTTGRKVSKKDSIFPAKNLKIFFIGLAVLVVGYFFLKQGPADSLASRTIAPVILIIGYCVIIPVAILYKERKKEKTE